MTDSSETSRPATDPTPSTPSAAAAQGSPTPAPPPPEPSPPGLLQRLWTLIVRLLILGMSISIGWIAGLLVAQVWPSRNPNPPIQERVMRQTSQTVRKVRQLPQWWQGTETTVAPVPNAPTDPADTQTVAPEDTPPIPSALSQEVVALQQELTRLENRLTELEQQTGQTGTGDLSDRLQQLAQQAATSQEPEPTIADGAPTESSPDAATETNPDGENPDADPADEGTTGAETTGEATPDPTTADPATPETTTPPDNDGLGRHAAAPHTEPPFPLVSDRIALPSALLFEPGGSLLTPAGQQLLDAIVPDLRRYGAVTFLVGSHTDGDLGAEEARQLTFQQSLAVQAYLASQLEDTNSRWLALGYGKTRPLAVGDAPGTEARNQRVEIGIVHP
ncbi:MAG: OmpA family protein [Spirulina sp.]